MTDGPQDRLTLITLTSDIVAAHVSNNSVAIDHVPALISSIYDALSDLGTGQMAEEAPREPAVSIRASVKLDHVTCLECGRKMKVLKRHLSTEHNLTVDEYRQRWGLSVTHALVAPDYAAQRAELAKKVGLGRVGRGAGMVGARHKARTKHLVNAEPLAKADTKPKGSRKLGLKFKNKTPAPAVKAGS